MPLGRSGSLEEESAGSYSLLHIVECLSFACVILKVFLLKAI